MNIGKLVGNTPMINITYEYEKEDINGLAYLVTNNGYIATPYLEVFTIYKKKGKVVDIKNDIWPPIAGDKVRYTISTPFSASYDDKEIVIRPQFNHSTWYP